MNKSKLLIPDYMSVIDGDKAILKPETGEPKGPNWLGDLEVGDNFLARPKNWNAPEVMQYSILDQSEKKRATQLTVHLSKEDLITWVDTEWFSKVYDLFQKLKEET